MSTVCLESCMISSPIHKKKIWLTLIVVMILITMTILLPNASNVRFSNMPTPLPSPPGVTTRSMAKTRPPTPPKQQSNLKITLKKLYNTRNPSYKVTGNTIPFDVFDTDSPPAINTILPVSTLFELCKDRRGNLSSYRSPHKK